MTDEKNIEEVEKDKNLPKFAVEHPRLLRKFKRLFPNETKEILESGVELPDSAIAGLEKFIKQFSYMKKNKSYKGGECTICQNGDCEPCNWLVTSCCWAQIPGNFNGELKYIPNPRMIYDTSCLKAVVTDCEVEVESPLPCPQLPAITVYQVRITGCIPWMASARWEAPQGICGGNAFGLGDDRQVDVCCKGSACVNNCICMTQTKEEADDICAILNGDSSSGLQNCSNFFGMTIPIEQDNACYFSNNALVKFFVFWILPGCGNG